MSGRILPKITTEGHTADVASSLSNNLNRIAEGGQPTIPPVIDEATSTIHEAVSTRQVMTLGELAQSLQPEQDLDEGWDAGAFLKKNVPQEKRSGSSLAGLALGKMMKG